MTTFGTLLKRYRQRCGFSQELLAERAGLSARAISDLERGLNKAPRYETFERLIQVLSLSPDEHCELQFAAWSTTPVETAPSHDSLTQASPASGLFSYPHPLTPLVGRKLEKATILAMLGINKTRLLTLTGPGGVGKTSLALEAVQEMIAYFPDGIVYVPLSAVNDASLVPTEIALALGMHEKPSLPLTTQLRSYLKGKTLLLVLDNLEQVLECASFIAELLAFCPNLQLLATSRVPLRLRGEHQFRLEPLPLEEASELFAERAQQVRQVREIERAEIPAICQKLDGLPLAIELAAVQIRTISLLEMGKRLSKRLAFLQQGPKDLPSRQQSIEETIAWSYELLSEEQQQLFRALGVFTGGWTLEACTVIYLAGNEPDGTAKEEALDLEEATNTIQLKLTRLVEASLVKVEILPDGSTHFDMLGLIRDYALQRLRIAGEEEEYRRQHARYYARLSEAVMAYFGPNEGVRAGQFEELARELANVRAAIEWTEHSGDAATGLCLSGFSRLLHVQGRLSEAVSWLERMLELDQETREAGKVTAPLSIRVERLYGMARTLVRSGKANEQALVAAREALALARQLDDPGLISNVFSTLGMVAQANGRLEEAESSFSESYRYAARAGHKGLESRALFHLGEVADHKGEPWQAVTLFKEARGLARAAGLKWDSALGAIQLGHLALQEGNLPQAEEFYREALAILGEFGSPGYIASCLGGFACIFYYRGDYTLSVKLYSAASVLLTGCQLPLRETEKARFETVLEHLKAALDKQTFAKEWASGTALSLEEAVALAISP